MRTMRLMILRGLSLALCLPMFCQIATAGEELREDCRTHERWLAKQPEQHTPESACPIKGTCDVPEERDQWIPDESSELLYIRLKFNVFAEDDGSNAAATQTEVDLQLDQLNEDYLPSRIQFVAETEFINSTAFRYWTSSEEFAMKSTYADSPATKLNVYVVTVDEGYSFGTFPWDPDALEFWGGIVITTGHFGPVGTTLAHEVGHNLGLWHTHHGVSEVNQCSACWERADGVDGDTTGDFAADTDPTPTNFYCSPPPDADPCSGASWATGSMDYHNYMGYAPSSCRDFFSAHQMGRTRCWFADRLTGWLAAPPALHFAYPQGLPTYVAPDAPTTVQVQVLADIGIVPVTGRAEGYASIAGGPLTAIPMQQLGGELYQAELPASGQCGATVAYYFTAPSTDAQEFSDPPAAPAELLLAYSAFGPRIVLDDDFEADVSAWTTLADASVTGGGWEAAEPVGTLVAGQPAAPGAPSHLGPQSARVFLTGNGVPGGAAGDADVDGGPVDLISPPVDLGANDALVSYDRWFYSNGADTLTVWVSNDGSGWTLVETVDGASNAWQSATFRVGDFVTPSSTVQVRFRTADAPDDSVTEAAIDRFRITELRCSACTSQTDCADVVFCNGSEVCDAGGLCGVGADPCTGQLCDEIVDACVDCFADPDCDDEVFCNGPEVCSANLCQPGDDPCPGQLCDDGFDVCVECAIAADCDDGNFCNGQELCVTPGVCTGGPAVCPGLCSEDNDECIGTVLPQARAGMPLADLTPEQAGLFAAGRVAFETTLAEPDGLGPAHNGTSCAGCHGGVATGGAGTVLETRFGVDDGMGAFDPLTALGGSLLQADGVTPMCAETVPVEANLVSPRATCPTFGAGLVEAIPDTAIEANALNPPGGVSGQMHMVEPLEAPGSARVGRFGWKSQHPTVRTASVEMALGSLGLTSPLRPADAAPNGDAALLSQCDTSPDPEDQPDGDGWLLTDRVTHFQRYLAPPPQTPRTGMNGETLFNIIGCGNCHVRQFTTDDDPGLEDAVRGQIIKPYSDFLLHDMGDAGDPIAQGDAGQREVRTAPLWGLRLRETLWHDGRISGGTVEERIVAAIAEHDSPGSEASSIAQTFQAFPATSRDRVVAFLTSLGRAEFDLDGDNRVDADDYPLFLGCFTGPGSFYTANVPCAVADVDQDGDVDDDDFELFAYVADGEAGQVPDGASLAGVQLRVEPATGGQIALSWGSSCRTADDDYAIYEGAIGDFSSHAARLCSTGGLTTATLSPAAGDTYYLAVPSNGFKEGSYGTDSGGTPRPGGAPFCLPQSIGTCDP